MSFEEGDCFQSWSTVGSSEAESNRSPICVSRERRRVLELVMSWS